MSMEKTTGGYKTDGKNPQRRGPPEMRNRITAHSYQE